MKKHGVRESANPEDLFGGSNSPFVQVDKPAKTKGKFTWGKFSLCVLVAQLLCEGFAWIMVFRLNMLPTVWLVLMTAVFVALFAVEYLLLLKKDRRKKKKIPVWRKVIAVILAVCICACSLYAGLFALKVKSAEAEVTTDDSSQIVAVVGVYVMASDPAQSVENLAGYNCAILNSEYDAAYTQAAVNEVAENTGCTVNALPADMSALAEDELADETSESTDATPTPTPTPTPVVVTQTQAVTDTSVLTTTPFNAPEDMAAALYNGSCRAIIMNETYASMIEETDLYTNFATDTRLVYECDITEEKLAVLGMDVPDELGTATEAVGDITTEPFILYLSGSDTRSKLLKVSRSDVNILMVVNPSTKQILLVNTPRDYFIPNPVSSSGAKDKLTHLGIYGVDCSIHGLENLYNCNINYYGQLNFTGFEALIDDIGGVTIDNPKAFNSQNVSGYSFASGEITLAGDEALAYSRERYAFSGGDNMRGQNQMRIIKGIVAKITSGTSVLTNYSSIMDDMSGMFVTSLQSSEIDSLVRMQLGDMASWNVESYAATGTGGKAVTYSMRGTNLYVMYPNEDSVAKAQQLISTVVSGGTLTDADVQ